MNKLGNKWTVKRENFLPNDREENASGLVNDTKNSGFISCCITKGVLVWY